MHSRATHQELFVVMKSKYATISPIRKEMRWEQKEREMLKKNKRFALPKTRHSKRSEDIHKCCELIEKHGGLIEDIFRNHPVINIMIPLKNKMALEKELKESGYIETIHPGLKFEGIHENGVVFLRYKAVLEGK